MAERIKKCSSNSRSERVTRDSSGWRGSIQPLAANEGFFKTNKRPIVSWRQIVCLIAPALSPSELLRPQRPLIKCLISFVARYRGMQVRLPGLGGV